MKQLVLFIIFCFSLHQAVNAQTVYEIRQSVDFFNANRIAATNWKKVLTESDIQGSPFLNDDFVDGSVYTKAKTQFVGIPLRYNIYNDQIEYSTPEGQVLALAMPETVEKIEIGEQNLEYIHYVNQKKIRQGFFILLEKGTASLYTRLEVVFEEAKNPAAYQEAQPARFVRKPDIFYIQVGQKPAIQLTRKKDIVEVFSPADKKITTYLEKNKVKPDDRQSLLELIRYYNSL